MNLKESILKTIVYFDIFDFPLTAEEVKDYLYKHDSPVHIKEIKGVLVEMTENGLIEHIRDYYLLKNRGKIVETRNTRKFISEKFWEKVGFYGKYMKSVPFVRMLAVCNNLAYNNASEESDIDLLVVIEPGRMWIARLIITIILQFYGVRRHGNKIKGRFCLSFFITTNKLNMEPLQIPNEDPYLAYWTQNLTPFYGKEVYDEFKRLNKDWLKNKYSLNFNQTSERYLYKEKDILFKRILESLLSGKIGDIFESFLKKTLKKKTLKSMGKLGPDADVIVNDDMLKFHNHDKRREYLEKFQITSSKLQTNLKSK